MTKLPACRRRRLPPPREEGSGESQSSILQETQNPKPSSTRTTETLPRACALVSSIVLICSGVYVSFRMTCEAVTTQAKNGRP